jgi:flagellar biosynthesis protein FliQ
VIGYYYRKPRDKQGGQGQAMPLGPLVLSALITGFLVSILEAICTGQVYLPTIAFVLKTTPLKIQALGYLAVYNLMFVLPLLVVFLFALLGATAGDFSRFLKKHLLAVKMLMALLFFGLGIFLLFGKG